MPDVIPDEIQSFLLRHIDSIAQLEALLFLRASPHHKVSCESIATTLYITPQEAAALLARLVTDGLVRTEDAEPALFHYSPQNDELQRIVDHLAGVYAKYLIPVTNFIHQKSRRSVQDFADAFKLKKNEDNDV